MTLRVYNQLVAINHILFDLDGTLADTAPDLVAALNFVLARHGKPTVSVEDARCWAGAGSARLIEQGFSISATSKEFHSLREQLLDYYDHHVCEGSCLFPGIDQLLTRLELADYSWGIVTNKPTRFTDPLLSALGLSDRAAVVVCGDTLPTNKPEPESVIHACRLNGRNTSTTALIGDDLRDIMAGRAAGTTTVAVTWGYASPDDLPENWGADHTVDSPVELERLLIQNE
jgi:2-phosphoglycolate phosphatase